MKIINGLLILGLAVAIGIGTWNYFSKPKIAYVRTGILISEYKGMQDANEIYQEKIVARQAKVDSMKGVIDLAITEYKNDSLNVDETEQLKLKNYIIQLQQGLYNYSKSMNEKTAEEEESMTLGILNQINSYIEDYGKSNGYDVILGTSSSGNVLYGDDRIDITNDILEGMNKNYAGE